MSELGQISILSIVAVFSGFSMGWMANGARLEGEINRLQSAHKSALIASQAAAEKALTEARAAEARGDALAVQQFALEKSNQKLLKEKNDVLQKITSGRACLDGTVVRVLNDDSGAGGRRGGPTPAGVAPRADGPAATDTDVALWAARARAEYDACRGRIDALRNFFDEEIKK
jgi:hypothetical protein